MAKPTLDDLQLVILKMLTAEQQEHANLLVQLDKRAPAGQQHMEENLIAVHKARMLVLEQVLDTIKTMKAKK